jgi:hypothetical protein
MTRLAIAQLHFPTEDTMNISRRGFLFSTTALICAAAVPPEAIASTNYVVGAIRWDSWAAGASTAFYSIYGQQDLSMPQWQFRAPACAAQISPYNMSFNNCNTQTAMDAEITAAYGGGLNYWAYCWYGTPENDGNTFQNAWALHQSSSIKSKVNWCILFQLSRMAGASAFASAFSTLVGYMQQANYQTVLGGRPLVYIFLDQATPLYWGGSFSSFQTSLNAFRSACTSAGLANPYICVLNSYPPTAYSVYTQVSADAISAYAGPLATAAGGEPYSGQIASDAAFWAAMVATTAPIIPSVQCGWDSRPRKQNPTPLVPGTVPWINSNVYVVPGSPAQIASDFSAAISFIAANAAACPSKAILAYSWNENDEGGSGLNPTYSSGGPVHATLDAVGAVLNAN